MHSAGEFTGGHTNACGQSLSPSVLALRIHVTSSGPRQKNQINPGSISVDRNASITVVPYNAWFQLTHLLKIQHLHISQFEVPAGHLAAMCVHVQYGVRLVLRNGWREW